MASLSVTPGDHARASSPWGLDQTTVAVMTAGGDCSGLNAVIRAIVMNVIAEGATCVGVRDGFLGLLEDRFVRLELADVSDILPQGGTILGSNNKINPQKVIVGKDAAGKNIYEDKTDLCLARLRAQGCCALIIIGGDGTQSGALNFTRRGFPCVGVPKTIDNDIVGTEITFGFSTAVQTVVDAMDKCRTTAQSHHRALVIETMGRNAGWIALHAGIGGGADAILLPEHPFEVDVLADFIRKRCAEGQGFALICCAEGAMPRGGSQIVERVDSSSADPIRLGGVAKWLSERIEALSGVETRYVVLGHVQRGGSPVAQDRVLASQFGNHAMSLLRAGKTGRMVVMANGQLDDIPLESVANKQRLVPLDHSLVDTARKCGTSFGTADMGPYQAREALPPCDAGPPS